MILERGSKFFTAISLLFLLSYELIGQVGTYYDLISPSSPTFISDLKTRIRVPYTQVFYSQFDETNIANFASKDNGDGTRSVFCVYSNYEYVYSGTFSFLPINREHTYAHSWQPTSPSDSGPEYSDQYHLFPTHETANSNRGNLPFGDVVTPTLTFNESYAGLAGNGDLVFEPRDAHKGDAARALFYMIMKYDDIGGNSWTFDWLNGTRLPALGVDPQDVQTLIDWHKQDPPDQWEIDRNDYIQSIQQNRNPFVDHPEWVDLINFNNLTLYSTVLATEPTNHVTDFATGTISSNSIQLNWIDAAAGTQVPEGYLILANTSGSFTAPTDGTAYSDDTNLADGSGTVNILYSASDSYTFSGLNSGTPYSFKIYSFNGSGSERNYKTDGTVPALNTQTTSTGGGSFADLIISEYIEGSSNNKAIEIYNGTSSTADLSGSNYNLQYYNNGSTSATITINLSGSIGVGNVFVIAHSSASSSILTVANQTDGQGWYNGNDAVLLRKGTTIIDVIGQVGFDPGTEWGSGLTSTANNTLRRKATVTQGDTNPNDAFDPSIEWIGYAADTFDGLGSPNPLPVELTTFVAKVVNNKVQLNWETETEVSNYGFSVERRAIQTETWMNIGFINGAGNSNSNKKYEFIDIDLPPGKYSYRLKQIDVDGSYAYSFEINVEINPPVEYSLKQNYPNPFNPSTKISWQSPVSSWQTLKVYDVLGNEVATLIDEYKPAGNYEVEFSTKGGSAAGGDASHLSSGIYFYRLQSGNYIETKKMILLR